MDNSWQLLNDGPFLNNMNKLLQLLQASSVKVQWLLNSLKELISQILSFSDSFVKTEGHFMAQFPAKYCLVTPSNFQHSRKIPVS